jgi:hypothetical protein
MLASASGPGSEVGYWGPILGVDVTPNLLSGGVISVYLLLIQLLVV